MLRVEHILLSLWERKQWLCSHRHHRLRRRPTLLACIRGRVSDVFAAVLITRSLMPLRLVYERPHEKSFANYTHELRPELIFERPT